LLFSRTSLLLIKTYTGPFIISFLVALFLFEMQFVWLYLDDLMGKDLGSLVIGQLLTYRSAGLVSMALPLAVLMSSIMTMGTLSENNELTAMKCAGASLFRILRPLIVFSILLSFGAFFFANNAWPVANLKFRSLLKSITEQKPTMLLEDNVFYNGIEGYSIRAGKNHIESSELEDVLIYDHTDKAKGNRTVIRARQGKMEQTTDNRYLVLTLSDGNTYNENSEKQKGKKPPHLSMTKGSFDRMVLRLDMSSLLFKNDNEDVYKSSYEMMTVSQLNRAVDSLQQHLDTVRTGLAESGQKFLKIPSLQKSDEIKTGVDSAKQVTWFLDELSAAQQAKAFEAAKKKTKRSGDLLENRSTEVEHLEKSIGRHKIEWHRKFFIAVACIVLFFIGAPLGAIIRKGGLGLPTMMALGLFIIFQLWTMAGEKMAKSGLLEPWIGMWLSTAVFLPLGVYLTWKAAQDRTLFNTDSYLARLKRRMRLKKPVVS